MSIIKHYNKLILMFLSSTFIEDWFLNQEDLWEDKTFWREDIQHINKELLKIMLDDKVEDSEISDAFIDGVNNTKDQLSYIEKSQLTNSLMKHITEKGLVISSATSFNKIFNLLSIKHKRYSKEVFFGKKIAGYVWTEHNYENFEKALNNGYKIKITNGPMWSWARVLDNSWKKVSLEDALKNNLQTIKTPTIEETLEVAPFMQDEKVKTKKEVPSIQEVKESDIFMEDSEEKIIHKTSELKWEDILSFKGAIRWNTDKNSEHIYNVFQNFSDEINIVEGKEKEQTILITAENRDEFIKKILKIKTNMTFNQDVINIWSSITSDWKEIFVDGKKITFNSNSKSVEKEININTGTKKSEVKWEDVANFKNKSEWKDLNINSESIYDIFQNFSDDILIPQENDGKISFTLKDEDKNKFIQSIFEGKPDYFFDQKIITEWAKISFDWTHIFVNDEKIIFTHNLNDWYEDWETIHTDRASSLSFNMDHDNAWENEAKEYLTKYSKGVKKSNNKKDIPLWEDDEMIEKIDSKKIEQCIVAFAEIREKSITIENLEERDKQKVLLLQSQAKAIFELEGDIFSLSNENDDLNWLNEQINKMNIALYNDKQTLKSQIEYYASENNNYINELINSENINELNQKNIKLLIEQNTILSTIILKTNIKVDGLNDLINKLKNQLTRKDGTINKLEKHSDNQEEMINSLQDKVNRLEKNRDKNEQIIANHEIHADNQEDLINARWDEILELEEDLGQTEKQLAEERKRAQEHLIEDQLRSDKILQGTLKFSTKLPKEINWYSDSKRPTTQETLNTLEEIFDHCNGWKTGHWIDKMYYKANKTKVDFTLQVALTALWINVWNIDAITWKNTKNWVWVFQNKHSLDFDKDAWADVYSMLIADIEAKYEI